MSFFFRLGTLLGLLMSNQSMALNIVNMKQPEYLNVLTSQAQLVQFPLSTEDIHLIQKMKEKLYELGGVGLAAPQVNQPRKIMAIYIPDDAALLREHVIPYSMHVMINPSYEAISGSPVVYDFEACYSVPHKAGKVPRFQDIKLSYFDESGQYHQQIESGFYARVIQHEIDHLNGVLIVDRLTAECVQGGVEEMMALRRSELSEEKQILFDTLLGKKANAQESS